METSTLSVDLNSIYAIDDFIPELRGAGYPMRMVGGGKLEITYTAAHQEYLTSILKKYDAQIVE